MSTAAHNGLDAADAHELLTSVGFLLVPGAPFDRAPAYLLVALRRTPTLAHFDPERIALWQTMDTGPTRIALEWPVERLASAYSWGTIEVIDRLGKENRFVSFGGLVATSRDSDLHAALFRSEAPILCAGGQSGPADPLGGSVAAFFGVLRAAAGNDRSVARLISEAAPATLYSAYLAHAITAATAHELGVQAPTRLVSVLRQERSRLERQCGADEQRGVELIAAMRAIPLPATG